MNEVTLKDPDSVVGKIQEFNKSIKTLNSLGISATPAEKTKYFYLKEFNATEMKWAEGQLSKDKILRNQVAKFGRDSGSLSSVLAAFELYVGDAIFAGKTREDLPEELK